MQVLILVGLLATTLAQPAQTTQKPKGFFGQIGDVFKDTAHAFGSAFTDYVKTSGSNLLHSVLPNLAGELLSGGLWSLIKTAATNKRDISADLQQLHDVFQHIVEEAEKRSEGLGVAIEGLVSNLVNDRLTPEEFAKQVPNIKVNAQDILHRLTDGIRQEVTSLLGNKRAALDLSALTDLLTTIETEGNKVIQQVETGLNTLTFFAKNPSTLFALIG
ncbi:uncharacterized protein [Littorina saxatilis]|uniref:Uncharacterized protein n=1 Tax=Littorina saxatilis TaxID=31220 RepID=A0AAN9APD2_9CAEN